MACYIYRMVEVFGLLRLATFYHSVSCTCYYWVTLCRLFLLLNFVLRITGTCCQRRVGPNSPESGFTNTRHVCSEFFPRLLHNYAHVCVRDSRTGRIKVVYGAAECTVCCGWVETAFSHVMCVICCCLSGNLKQLTSLYRMLEILQIIVSLAFWNVFQETNFSVSRNWSVSPVY